MHTDNEQNIGPDGLASVTLTLRWTDGRARHEDHLHFEKFSIFHEQDSFPDGLAEHIRNMQEGESISARFAAGEITGIWDPSLSLVTSPSAFDRHFLRGLEIHPHSGRFYPRGFFHDTGGIVRQQMLPARITALDGESMSIDLNHPLSCYDLMVELHIDQLLNDPDLRADRTSNCLDQLFFSPGLKAKLSSGEFIDFGDDNNGMERLDPCSDDLFYQQPRFVQHLDRTALQTVNELYRRLIDDESDVLDLMASHDSHIEDISLRSLHVLGMNDDELSSNKLAATFTVHDLNHEPELPYNDECLDAVICTASIEYLTDPLAVFAEVKRVLRPTGVFIITFSDRWFPTKAIRIWKELHEFERVGMICQWMEKSGFTGLHTFSSHGMPRPEDDPYINEMQLSDPVHAVWGTKQDHSTSIKR